MLDARDFGIKAAVDFYDRYITQGSWTRCLQCMRDAGIDLLQQAHARKASRTSLAESAHEQILPQAAVCRRCVERDDWKQSLVPNGHGCSACKKVFAASSWDEQMIRKHRHSDRDLVCPDCTERGYAPGNYEEHRCTECGVNFGHRNFNKEVLYNCKRRGGKSSIVCTDCQTKLQCGKCKIAYELKYWTTDERKHHNGPRAIALVCKTCRALGFNPRDLASYTCQTCQCNLGAQKFEQRLLDNYKRHKSTKLRCKQCASAAEARLQQLRRQLQKSTRRCKCYCLFHRDKCPLTPVIFGEMRWPGSDGFISADDRRYLDECDPPPAWWTKAWGRT